MKKLIPVILVAAAVLMFGCSGFNYEELATASDIQGEWSLTEVSGILCCSGLMTYDFEGDPDYYDTLGEVTATTSGTSVYFDYTFDNTESIITIDGATAANGGLVDGDYYVYIDGDKMAWRFENNPNQTAYIFTEE